MKACEEFSGFLEEYVCALRDSQEGEGPLEEQAEGFHIPGASGSLTGRIALLTILVPLAGLCTCSNCFLWDEIRDPCAFQTAQRLLSRGDRAAVCSVVWAGRRGGKQGSRHSLF